MTDTQTGLLRAIAFEPEDDTVRLAYADFLDENGQPARAEFVRVQVELARLTMGWKPENIDCLDMYLDPQDSDSQKWKHAVTWVRGFPVVRCRLDEVGKQDSFWCQSCDIYGPDAACPACDGSRSFLGNEWTPTEWAVRCVREAGASFEVTTHEAEEVMLSGRYTWRRSMLPTAVFDELQGHGPLTTLDEARAILNAALLRLVAREAYKEAQP